MYHASRTGSIFGVMMIDLDSFKLVNDSLGHERGDELLKKVSMELSACVRKSDTVARFGGDEFLILINNVLNKEDIVKVAKKIMDTFRKPFNVGLQEFFVTGSGGVVIYPADGENVEDLIKNADLAMYNAKEKGKNQFVICASSMKGEVRKVMELSNSLYYAQEYKELSLFYQPQINIQSGEIVGLEALLRWKHPRMGMVLPRKFIPLAEKTGLINPIGEWVIQNACRQNVEWQSCGLKPIRMAVNVSFVQLRNPKLISQLQRILHETGMDPKYLELEITESVAMLEPKYNINMLNRLKKLGLTVAIDDFGTEYSSLSRLKQLPIDRIKMDMQFVKAIDNCEKDRSFAEVIISLAKGLGLEVIAEGVETETQLKFLSQKMCEEAQGYYFSEPKSAEEIKWLLTPTFMQQKDV
ncbi:MAG: putative bifunctional diguanylate cyclase/phosphodiesterase [Clostridiaceae bacterium]